MDKTSKRKDVDLLSSDDRFKKLEEQKFLFNFHNTRANKSRKQIQNLFEMKGDPDNFYLFTLSSEDTPNPSGNKFNPYYSEVTLSRFS